MGSAGASSGGGAYTVVVECLCWIIYCSASSFDLGIGLGGSLLVLFCLWL